MSMRIKLFVALPSEFPKGFEPMGVDVIYTGVGKINAAIKATEILKDLSPSETIVINYGSAGASGDLVGCLVTCKNFVQKDIDARPFVNKTITPFDETIYPKLNDASILSFGNGLICNTQDKFEKKPAEINDMEAYSIAKVCKIYGFDFVSYKYISDSGNHTDWVKNHYKGIELFLQKLKEDFKVS
jgi:adenosylhomocysteine nucleosidase